MIVDCIENADKYSGISERIAVALNYLAETDFAGMPDGKVDISGDDIFAIIQRYNPVVREEGKWEAHRKYIDVQYIVSGTEQIGVGLLDKMNIMQEYKPADDVLFADGSDGYFVNMTAGMFMVLFPHDVHMPCIAIDGVSDKVTKVVVKVAL